MDPLKRAKRLRTPPDGRCLSQLGAIGVVLGGAATMSAHGPCRLVAGLHASGSSQATLEDVVLLDGLQLSETASVLMQGGAINPGSLTPVIRTVYGDLFVRDAARLVLRDLELEGRLELSGNARAWLENAVDRTAGGYSIRLAGQSSLDVVGGSFYQGLAVNGEATLRLQDTAVQGEVVVWDNASADLRAVDPSRDLIVADQGRIFVQADSFEGGFREIGLGEGHFYARDAQGNSTRIEYEVYEEERIALVPLPEPGGVASGVSALLVLAALRRRFAPQG